ncbi:SRPBCC family protein [Paractinoplanes ferrugineus]|uniref:Polyketide cyclase /reductase n=1 Tax=Paractinoplanes ferrugineus TaxID=113564 RepID=A0A919JE61_9ACTN|nr:SRPBCC family protein [Actinoplanes ferrugineus]GIE15501.1 hypothetical protein Afe05nite_73410 [Actinoplanes ferrugineus]
MTRQSLRRRVIAALFTTSLIAGVLGAATPATAAPSGGPHRPLTCGGQGVDATAKIRYRTEILIPAPLRTIWNLQTDVADWPAWQTAVATSERLDSGRFRAGSQFRWTTPVLETPTTPATTLVITSTVQQLRHEQCIRWTGPAVGDGLSIDKGVHVWNFTQTRRGVLVRTEETWNGAQVEADVPNSTAYLAAGLEAWLTELKTTAETDACRV